MTDQNQTTVSTSVPRRGDVILPQGVTVTGTAFRKATLVVYWIDDEGYTGTYTTSRGYLYNVVRNV